MGEEHLTMPHKLTLNERSKLTMSGVTDVISFDENTVVLRTELGTLLVHGHGLQLNTLPAEGGQVVVDGKIAARIYEELRQKGGWLNRLLR